MSFDRPGTRAEWDARGVQVALGLANEYRAQMYAMTPVPREASPGTPMNEWPITDKINLRDGAVGLINDLCLMLVELGEGSQAHIDQTVKAAYSVATRT